MYFEGLYILALIGLVYGGDQQICKPPPNTPLSTDTHYVVVMGSSVGALLVRFLPIIYGILILIFLVRSS